MRAFAQIDWSEPHVIVYVDAEIYDCIMAPLNHLDTYTSEG
jgi:hypothetical protein